MPGALYLYEENLELSVRNFDSKVVHALLIKLILQRLEKADQGVFASNVVGCIHESKTKVRPKIA